MSIFLLDFCYVLESSIFSQKDQRNTELAESKHQRHAVGSRDSSLFLAVSVSHTVSSLHLKDLQPKSSFSRVLNEWVAWEKGEETYFAQICFNY